MYLRTQKHAARPDWNLIEKKWRHIWDEQKIFESNPDSTKQKYLVTVAYPYPNSPQHIGHGRTYTLADVHARYKRMRGYNVLFPMGFHYTGTPILAMSRRLVSGDTDLYNTFRNVYGVPSEVIKSFNEPANIARFFHREIKEGMKEMGFSIDWRREFTTIDEAFSKFISWQFNLLKKKGLIIQGSHPVGWCPRDQNPVSQHDTLGDIEPNFIEYTLVNFYLNDTYVLPVATLRPETVYGVTNLWVNPHVKYVVAHVGEDDQPMWIISRDAVLKLKHQGHNVDIHHEIDGMKLVGQNVRNPVTQSSLPIYPAAFVEPRDGTGLVMSVPAHAPYDYQALLDLSKVKSSKEVHNPEIIKPITIIESDGYDDNHVVPSQIIIERLGVKDQHDPLLEKATSELYSHEFYKGRLKENTGKYAGMMVSEAKDLIRSELLQSGNGEILYEFVKKPVKCRCGEECVVKVLSDQWFLNYSDAQWKDLAHECINRMDIVPDEIRSEFNYVVDWLKERACARKSGLGTRLPWDQDWIIESLSDSVIYTAYYIISRYIHSQDETDISAQNLTESLFDYVFLGEGSPKNISQETKLSEKLICNMRAEFTYFYPVDTRHSGRDLVPNHLTFFVFNHVAIFDRTYWPKQIVVNGSVLMDGKKMSKSFGNIIPLRDAVKEYSADTIRVAMLSSAELLQDADFSFEALKGIRSRLDDMYQMGTHLSSPSSNQSSLLKQFYGDHSVTELEDRWIMSMIQRRIRDTTELMDRLRVREVLHTILYSMEQDLQWYNKRIKSKGRNETLVTTILTVFLETRIKLLAPFAPFLTAEVWSSIVGEATGIKANLVWPSSMEESIDPAAEESEILIKNLIQDIQNILKVTKMKPSHINIYTSASWKWKVYQKILELIVSNRNSSLSDVMKVMGDDSEISRARSDVKLIKKIMEDILSITLERRSLKLNNKKLDERRIIEDAASLISSELGDENIAISVFSEDDEDAKKNDPQSKARFSRPFKPAIYLI
ncbi:MAG TPA: leucine--tRNA ligase [Nitrososphaeraceae archaeon]|nr:leucine--tRNA ligase [Nitrososphaeraceae archaeon]